MRPGCVPVGVSPLRPFGARPPARRDSFGIRMANKTAIMAAVWRTEGALRHAQNLLNPPPNFDCPYIYHKKTALNIDDKRKGQFPNIAPATRGLSR